LGQEIPDIEKLMNAWPQRRLEKPRRLLPAAMEGAREAGWWADLGCGDGVFTGILVRLAPAARGILAVDRDKRALRELRDNFERAGLAGAPFFPVRADFRHSPLGSGMEGILIANALHFLRAEEQLALLANCHKCIRPGGRLIVVEYNTGRSTGAVPHPLPEAAFIEMAGRAGFGEAQVVVRTPSSYLGEMYAGTTKVI
jgi:SAM-dependent methyltransferase